MPSASAIGNWLERSLRRLDSVTALQACAIYLGLSLLLFGRVWASGLRESVGPGSQDVHFGIWSLVWTPFAITHRLNPFFTSHLNWPDGVNLAWNGFLPVAGIVLWPITASLGPVASYDVLATMGPALSGWAAFLAVRRLTGSGAGALAGGLLYAFSPYMAAQAAAHVGLTLAFAPPLLLLLLHEAFLRRRWGPLPTGLALAGLGLVQLLTFEETLAICAVGAAIGLGLCAPWWRSGNGPAVRSGVAAIAIGAGVFTVLGAWPLWYQFFGPLAFSGAIHAGSPSFYETDLLNLVVPTPIQTLSTEWTWALARHFTSNITEWNGYLGLPLLVLLAWTVWGGWQEPAVRFAAIMLVTFLILTLGPILHVGGREVRPVFLPYLVFTVLPVLKAMLASRLAIVVYLFAAVLLGFFVRDHVLNGPPRLRIRAACLVGIAAATLVPHFPYWSSPDPIPSRFLTAPPTGVVLVVPYANSDDARAMLWQAAAGMSFRMPEGYFLGSDGHGRFIDHTQSLTGRILLSIQAGHDPGVTPELGSAVRADLESLGVDTIIVGPLPDGQAPAATTLFTSLAGPPERDPDGLLIWRLH